MKYDDSMRSITFSFRPDVAPAVQEAVLDLIRSWKDVREVGRVHPHARKPEIFRMCFGYVGSDSGETAGRIAALPEIEYAFTPAERQLV